VLNSAHLRCLLSARLERVGHPYFLPVVSILTCGGLSLALMNWHGSLEGRAYTFFLLRQHSRQLLGNYFWKINYTQSYPDQES
jgi:hypothetical protein